MRIISGIYKGKKINGFNIDGTRPTMDRVKESLFAMIGQEIKNKTCLDLYAGSGSLGLEAISNGAKSCLFVDKNEVAIKTIRENAKGIPNASILKSDAFQIHQKIQTQFDFVFLDPPYHLSLIKPTLDYLLEHKLLKKDAIIVCEYEEENFPLEPFQLLKERKYGKKMIKIIKNSKML